MIKFLLPLLALVSLATPAAAAPRDSFVSVVRTKYLTLDPASMYDLTSFAIAGNIYEPLVFSRANFEQWTEDFGAALAEV